jgi:hypothetical protein
MNIFFYKYNQKYRDTAKNKFKEQKKEAEDFFPKHGGKEIGKQEGEGMQLEENLIAAQDATWWAQKFALRLIWLADQLVEDGIVEKKSDITDEIRQSCVIEGLLMARVTIRESPSKITDGSLRDRDNWAARRAAEASP